MTRRRLALAPAALAAGAGVVALIPDGARVDPVEVAATLAVGWSFVVSGLIAWERRPETRLGQVMVLTGFAWFASRLAWAPYAAPATAGVLFEAAYILGVGFLLLAFPAGRLRTRLERRILLGAAVVVGPLQVAWMLFGMGDEDRDCGCASNLLEVAQAPGISEAIVRVQQGAGAVLVALTIAVLARRWRRATPPERFAIAPVLWTGVLAFGLLLARLVNDSVDERLGSWPDAAADLALATVPIAFLAGVLRTRLARGDVARLLVDLDRPQAPGGLRDALARVLRDPSLQVAYWLPDAERYADVDGRPVAVPADPATVTEVERDGRRIAALVHDPALAEDPALVRSVSAAAALALENERLQAELRARLEDLRASRVRIVEAAQEERRRIERDLHDGTQQRLVSIAMTLGLVDSRLDGDPGGARPVVREARAALAEALEELRSLSQGIHPGLLTERGLGPALDDLAYRAGVPLALTVEVEGRLPERIEAAVYFVVSEALANVAKHAGAGAARVTVRRQGDRVLVAVCDDGVGGADPSGGSGLRGLRDRVEALGGAFELSSAPGAGTTIRAAIPCG